MKGLAGRDRDKDCRAASPRASPAHYDRTRRTAPSPLRAQIRLRGQMADGPDRAPDTEPRSDPRRAPTRGRSPARSAPLRGCGSCGRSEEHTSELQSLMRISYAVFGMKKKT